ncbi:MAG: hypothetical protein PWP23_1703 [Candidatus Sumerlaeota bacterium]|nr:hypothetical protein [Candidatus Sumerlaeota bacterium]
MKYQCIACIAMLSLCVSVLPAEPPRIGRPVIEPQGTPTTGTYGFLDGRATSRVVRPGVIEITFTTLEATPPAMVYIGINDITEGLDYARYRSAEKEQWPDATPRREHRIEVEFSGLTRKMFNTDFEPRINWRAEVYLPSKASSRFVEGRNYFNPATLDAATNVLFGPTVEQVTENTAVIAFDTDEAVVGSVRVGEQVVTGSGPATRHELAVAGLQPDTEYEYQVTAGTTTVRPYRFRTAGAESFEFAAMVDSREGVGGGMQNHYGVNGFSLFALGSDAYYRGADFLIFPGDLINGYSTDADDFRNQLDSFRRIFEPVHARVPIWESMGNHEALINSWLVDGKRISIDKPGAESAEAVFAEAFVNPVNGPANEGEGSPSYDENVYFFDWGHARIFMLNNNYWWSSDPHNCGGNLEGGLLANQMTWLREQVAAADADPEVSLLFFAAQEPPFPNGGHTRDAMWYRGGDTNRDGVIDDADVDIVEMRNEMWEIIAASPKTVAFITGDEHAYSRLIVTPETNVGHKRLPDGSEAVFQHTVWQVTSGGAGAPWYDKELNLPWSPWLKAHSTQPHYAYFRVNGDNVELEVYSQTGERIDTAVLRSGGRNTVD